MPAWAPDYPAPAVVFVAHLRGSGRTWESVLADLKRYLEEERA